MIPSRWRRRLVAVSAAAALSIIPATVASAAPEIINIDRDDTTVLHNPGMGWLMYVEEYGTDLPEPAEFWESVDPYLDSASGLYLRVPWSRAEPEEGKYAWDNDPKWQGLVNGATERGLKLAFRIYTNKQDSHVQATPEFVFTAGAEVAQTGGDGKKDTYDNDPVFLEKYTNFVKAFGAKYNDPLTVDFVDMNTIGAWGEMHSTHLKAGGKNWGEIVDYLHQIYAEAFPNTMVAMNYAQSSDNMAAYDRSINNGAAMRRDGVGSVRWFHPNTKKKIKENRLKSIFIAENCYQAFTVRETACDEAFKPLDKMGARVVNEALDLHANYLDLRKDVDVKWWNEEQPELVKKFELNGGYRLAPKSVTVDRSKVAKGEETSVKVVWDNTGVGRLPNDIHGWNDRFKIQYQIVAADGAVATTIDGKLDPGIITADYARAETFKIPALAPGEYTLRTAIVDSAKDNEPGVTLAAAGSITAPEEGEGRYPKPQWVPLATFTTGTADVGTQTDPTEGSVDVGTQTDPTEGSADVGTRTDPTDGNSDTDTGAGESSEKPDNSGSESPGDTQQPGGKTGGKTTGQKSLAATGASVTPYALSALFLLIAGGSLVMWRRSRN